MQLNIPYQLLESEILNVHNADDFVFKSVGIDTRVGHNLSSNTFVAIKGDQFDGHDFIDQAIVANYTSFVVHREDVFHYLKNKNQVVFLVRNTLRFTQELAKVHREKFKIPVIAITGSNGKTICKEWIYSLLNIDYRVHRSPKSYNSQIGVALSLLELNEKHELAIIEAGISRKGEMHKLWEMIQPTAGLMTNNLGAHLEGFGNLEEKNKEKHLLFKNVDVLIENQNTSINNSNSWKNSDVTLSANKGGTVITFKDGLGFTVPFISAIDIENSINSFLVARLFAKDIKSLCSRMTDLRLLSNRWEQFEGKNNNIIINDSYSLDTGSLKVSLEQLDQISTKKRKIVFLGISDESISFLDSYINILNDFKVEKIVLVSNLDIEVKQKNVSHFKNATSYQFSSEEFHNSIVFFKASRNFSLAPFIALFKQNNHRTRFEINLESIRNNLGYYRSVLSNQTNLLVMVKASSYGTGLSEMSHFLQSSHVDYLGVAFTQEGIELRRNNIELPVIVMNPDELYFDQAIEHNLEPSVYSFHHLDQIVKVLIDSGKKDYPIHIKIDTGMNRLGFHADDITSLIDYVKAQPEIHVKSVFTHFSAADDPEYDDFTKKQFELFNKLALSIEDELGYELLKHCCNSNAALRFPAFHLDMVRVGIGVHGVSVNNNNLDPSLSLYSYISQIKQLKSGDIVGYGNKYVVRKDTTIGVIPIGYADGITRSFGSNGGYLIIEGQKAPVIGNVCMDMLMVDLSECAHIKVGATAEIFGTNISIEEHAKFQNTIAYEIACKISQRIPRVYIK